MAHAPVRQMSSLPEALQTAHSWSLGRKAGALGSQFNLETVGLLGLHGSGLRTVADCPNFGGLLDITWPPLTSNALSPTLGKNLFGQSTCMKEHYAGNFRNVGSKGFPVRLCLASFPFIPGFSGCSRMYGGCQGEVGVRNLEVDAGVRGGRVVEIQAAAEPNPACISLPA